MINKLKIIKYVQLALILCCSFLAISCNEQLSNETTQAEVKVPEWASVLDQQEYVSFIKEVDDYFQALNLDYDIDDGVVMVKENKLGLDQLGLRNLIQACKQAEMEDYPEIISTHFDTMIESMQFQQEFTKIEDNYAEVKKYIGVKFYNSDDIDAIGKENMISKEFAGKIYAVVIFDFPKTVMNVSPKKMAIWNKTADQLFTIGIDNIKEKYPFTLSKETLDGYNVWLVQAEQSFGPNIVFDIDKRKELIGRKGSLIALPTRDIALIYPIENLELMVAITGLIPLIDNLYQEGPGSLSSELFWYKDKVMTPLPYLEKEGKLHFNPPAKFVELITQLQEP